jgi:hypothetical protein
VFDEAQARADFIEHYQLEGKVVFDGKYWHAVKTDSIVVDTLLQGTTIVMYDTWIACAKFIAEKAVCPR